MLILCCIIKLRYFIESTLFCEVSLKSFLISWQVTIYYLFVYTIQELI